MRPVGRSTGVTDRQAIVLVVTTENRTLQVRGLLQLLQHTCSKLASTCYNSIYAWAKCTFSCRYVRILNKHNTKCHVYTKWVGIKTQCTSCPRPVLLAFRLLVVLRMVEEQMMNWSSWTCFPSDQSPECTCCGGAFVGPLVIRECIPCVSFSPLSSSAPLSPQAPSRYQHLQGKGEGGGTIHVRSHWWVLGTDCTG